jgi:peptide chain release factor 1
MLSKVEELVQRHRELDALLAQPEIATQRELFKKTLQEHGALRKLASLHTSYVERESALVEAQDIVSANEDPELVELAREEIGELEAAMERLRSDMLEELLSADEDDDKNVIMEIQAGAGGDEAALFVSDLLRMYGRLADQRRWKLEELSSLSSKSGGLKHITLSVSGSKVHRELQFESGGHRVQRVPETESQGRIHTSLATVVVLPEIAEIEIDLPADEIEEQRFCASGPGGQHVNKTESAVRLIHGPTGIKVECQDEKSQHMNRSKAMRILRARVAEHRRQIQERELGERRRGLRGSGDRSERIRTYNYPQNRVTDHRVNLTLYCLDRVVEGELDELIAKLQEHAREEKLKAL